MTARIRVALVGLGRMGRNWLRVIRESPRFDLVAIVDPAAPEATHRERPCMLPAIDAAIVATPTALHGGIAFELLMRGTAVLVEKPIAATHAEAQGLVATAAGNHARLAVGHVERFNPAVRALFDVVRSGRIGNVMGVEAVRRGMPPAVEAPGNNAALDLGVHDIDLARLLLGPLRVDDAAGDDFKTEAHMVSRTGVPVSVHAAWCADIRQRSLYVSGSWWSVVADMLTRTVRIVERGRHTEEVPVEPGDPLTLQLAAFARLIDGEDASPLCSGEDGAAAVLLAERAMRGEIGGTFV